MNVLYSRYNRHRLAPFQIATSISESNGAKIVSKKALTAEASGHIQEILAGQELLQRNLNQGPLRLPRLIQSDNHALVFQYVDGQSLDSLLFQSFRGKDKAAFLKTIDDYCALLGKAFKPVASPQIGPKAQQVFGIASSENILAEKDWLPVGVIDAMFENIIVSGNAHFLIDTEWVFEGSLPLSFVVFRSLFYFHAVKYFELGIAQWISFDALLEHCRIDPERAKLFRKMEEKFQAYVYGPERCYQYKEQYKKRQIAVHALEKTIAHQRAVLRKYHDAIRQDEAAISEMVNSFSWRIGRKITGTINFLCPPGSLHRRLMGRLLAPLQARSK